MDGFDGLREYRSLQQMTSTTGFTVNTVRAFQDGQYVFLHSDFGTKIGFDIFRFEDGQITEHWDVVQDKPATLNIHNHTMLDGPTEVRDLDKTAANKKVIANYVVRGAENPKLGVRFFKGFLTQHNPLVGDGLLASARFVAKNRIKPFSHVKRILGQGNFVLVLSEGSWGPTTNATAFYNLYRLEKGKIVEHWDAMENIPSADE